MQRSLATMRTLPAALVLLTLVLGGCSLATGDPPVSANDLALIENTMQQVEKSYVVPVEPDPPGAVVGGEAVLIRTLAVWVWKLSTRPRPTAVDPSTIGVRFTV